MRTIVFPIKDKKELENLKVGESVYISGTVYTARDAAHKKLIGLLEKGEELPIKIENQCIYYTGPCPAPKNRPIGSCGPTTSGRMDAYAPTLLDLGEAGMIGKGNRNDDVINSCRKNKAVYFAVPGGAGALIADCVKECEVIAFPELLSEAIHKIVIENMPVIVAIDTDGNDIFSIGREKYKK